MKQSGQDKGTLLLALIAGLSINGTFAAIFSSIVPLSIFPLIALVLTVYDNCHRHTGLLVFLLLYSGSSSRRPCCGR